MRMVGFTCWLDLCNSVDVYPVLQICEQGPRPIPTKSLQNGIEEWRTEPRPSSQDAALHLTHNEDDRPKKSGEIVLLPQLDMLCLSFGFWPLAVGVCLYDFPMLCMLVLLSTLASRASSPDSPRAPAAVAAAGPSQNSERRVHSPE